MIEAVTRNRLNDRPAVKDNERFNWSPRMQELLRNCRSFHNYNTIHQAAIGNNLANPNERN